MRITRNDKSSTETVLEVEGDEAFLQNVKLTTLKHLAAKHVKIPGFRAGTAPTPLIEKHVNAQLLQTEFLQEALNRIYAAVVRQENLRPVADPRVTVKKFVPFSQLEIEFNVEVVNIVKLADYKSIHKPKPKIEVSAQDINDVLGSLRVRAADRIKVERGAKEGDEVVFDFKGVDEKGKLVSGAEGKQYPLVLGSNTFIPGFESNLIGLKAQEDKSFTLNFPKDYSVSALRGKKVSFSVKVRKVSELKKPDLNDAFAAKVGPFKTIAELKTDIKRQLSIEKQRVLDQTYQNEILNELTDMSVIAIPKRLVDSQMERSEQEERQNLSYRGQTWEEHLKKEGVTEEEHRERNRPAAERVVKTSILLSEIAEAEKISVTPEELEVRLRILKKQYKDPTMQAELDKTENRQEIVLRILTEKTIDKIVRQADGTSP